MDEEKSNFRATLFLEEQFSFLQNNNAQEEDIVNHSTDVSVDDQVGGPLTTTEDIFIEGNVCDSASHSIVDNSRVSVSSSASSAQSDSAQNMSFRTSSASSRGSAVSHCESSKPNEMKSPKEEIQEGSSNVSQHIATSVENDISNSTHDSAEEDVCQSRESVCSQVSNTVSSYQYAEGEIVVTETDKEEITEGQNKTEHIPCSERKSCHTLLPQQNDDNDSAVAHGNSLRPPAAVERNSSRQSVMPDGTRISLFVNESFNFLDSSVSEGDSDSNDTDSAASVKFNQNNNLDNQLPKETGKESDKAGNAETSNNSKSGEIADNDAEQLSKSSELPEVQTELSENSKCESKGEHGSTSVSMRSSSSNIFRKSTISKLINSEFDFLNEEDENACSDNSESGTDKNGAPQTAAVDGNKNKTFMSHHSRNLSAEVKIHEKPQSPVIERIIRSDVSLASVSSTRSRSISPGQSSRSSSWSSETESGDDLSENVFLPEETQRPSLQRSQTLLDSAQLKLNSHIPSGIMRSQSVSTSVPEKETHKHYRRKDIERPLKQKDSKSKSISKFVRQTKYIPETTVVLEKTDPEQAYGFHFMKDEENVVISPWFISTLEAGGIAQAKGIEVGSRVVRVNGEDIVDSPLDAVIQLIKSDPCKVELTLYSSTDPVPQKSGYLWKQSTGLRRTFKKRWFILKQDNCLYYYKTEGDIDPLGAICLSNYSVSKAQDIDPTAFKLEKFEQKKYIFKADTVEEMTKWGGLMEQAANARTGSYPETTTHHLNLPAIQIKDPDFYGYLHKRGDSRKVWRKRYCVLKDGSLYYYKDPNDSQARGVAHLHGYLLTSEFSQGRKHGFILSPPELKMRTFYFGTDTEAERKKWRDALQVSISKWKQADEINQ